MCLVEAVPDTPSSFQYKHCILQKTKSPTLPKKYGTEQSNSAVPPKLMKNSSA